LHNLGEKIMKKIVRATLVLALLCAAMSTAMFASDNAYLYLVQGIPGYDYSTSTDPQFPVDVLLNDEICYEHGLAFGILTPGPLTLAAGSYDVKVSVANSTAPCTNSPLVDSTVTLDAGKDVSAVFALSDTGTPTLTTFTNSFYGVPANYGRILFAHAADASALEVVLQNTTTHTSYTYSVNSGALLNATFPAGNYTIEVNQGTTTLVSSTPLDLYSQSVTMLFAVGEANNNTLTLAIKTVRNVI
jgi:hypothetical protein